MGSVDHERREERLGLRQEAELRWAEQPSNRDLHGRWESWPADSRPAMRHLWMVDDGPGGIHRTLVAKRGYTRENGQRVEQDEIVLLSANYQSVSQRHRQLVRDGWLEPLHERTLVTECRCRRYWGSTAALAAHGCTNLTEAERTASPPSTVEAERQPTGRLREVARLWGLDWTAPEIAAHLNITKKTAANYVYQLRRKYGPDAAPNRRDVDSPKKSG